MDIKIPPLTISQVCKAQIKCPNTLILRYGKYEILSVTAYSLDDKINLLKEMSKSQAETTFMSLKVYGPYSLI